MALADVCGYRPIKSSAFLNDSPGYGPSSMVEDALFTSRNFMVPCAANVSFKIKFPDHFSILLCHACAVYIQNVTRHAGDSDKLCLEKKVASVHGVASKDR